MLNAKKWSKSRNKVRCFCRDCNGIYVDSRTKNKHSINQNIVKNTPNILQIDNNPMSESSQRSFINKESSIEPQTFVNEKSSIEPQTFVNEESSILYSKMRKRNRNKTLRERDNKLNQEDSSSNKDYGETNDTDSDNTSFDDNNDNNDDDDGDDDDDDDDDDNDNNDNIFEDYSPPNYNLPDNFNDIQNISEEWIIIFILRFQTRYRLPDTAIDTLIKFVKHILTELDCDRFKDFPTSLYTARKKLGLKHQFVNFSVCPSCHKLHNVDNVEGHTIQEQKAVKKCDHIQYPNNRHLSLRKCDTPLSEQKELGADKIVNSPSLIYPMASIKDQLLHMGSLQ